MTELSFHFSEDRVKSVCCYICVVAFCSNLIGLIYSNMTRLLGQERWKILKVGMNLKLTQYIEEGIGWFILANQHFYYISVLVDGGDIKHNSSKFRIWIISLFISYQLLLCHEIIRFYKHINILEMQEECHAFCIVTCILVLKLTLINH